MPCRWTVFALFNIVLLDETVTIVDKEIKRNRLRGKYIVYAVDQEGTTKTYEMKDNWLTRIWNGCKSDPYDFWNRIEKGKRYRWIASRTHNHLYVMRCKEVKEKNRVE